MLKNALESQLINQLSDTLRSPPSLGDYSDLFLTKESQVFLSLIKRLFFSFRLHPLHIHEYPR